MRLHRNTTVDPVSARTPAATARPRPKSRWSRRKSRRNSTSACRDAPALRARSRSSSTTNPGCAPVRNRAASASFWPGSPGQDATSGSPPVPVLPPARSHAGTSAPGGSRNGRILAAVPAREPVGEPGRPVHFVTGGTSHRVHVGRRHQTRPVAGHANATRPAAARAPPAACRRTAIPCAHTADRSGLLPCGSVQSWMT